MPSPHSNQLLRRYLARYADHSDITLVGPMLGEQNHQHHQYEEPVIFVDGGARWRPMHLGHTLGDGDSFSGLLDTRLDPRKDFSDLAFALNEIGNLFHRVHLIGFLGGRRDHELFNFGEAHQFLSTRTQPGMVCFDNRVIALSSGRWELQLEGLFSLGALVQNRITLWGQCEYHCPAGTLLKPLSSLGLSNVGHGTVHLECEAPVLLFTESVGAVDVCLREGT